MTDADLDAIVRAWASDRIGTHWDWCHLVHRHHDCAILRLVAEIRRQRVLNMELAERLAACSSVLGRAAERGKVCECQQPQEGHHVER